MTIKMIMIMMIQDFIKQLYDSLFKRSCLSSAAFFKSSSLYISSPAATAVSKINENHIVLSAGG